MGEIPALDNDLNPADVVKESIGVMRCHRLIRVEIGPVVPRTRGDLLDSLNQKQRTTTNQSDLQNETFLLIKDPNARTNKKLT